MNEYMNNWYGYGQVQQQGNGTQNSGIPGGSVQAVMPQTRQSVQPQYIRGRMVKNEEDILPAEIPNDGTYGIFITSDFSTIYAKTWGRTGLVDTKKFVLSENDFMGENGIPEGCSNSDIMGVLSGVMNRLNNIEKALSKPKPRYNKTYQNNGQRYQKDSINSSKVQETEEVTSNE